MGRLLRLAGSCAALLLTAIAPVRADVGGIQFTTEFNSSVRGEFDAQMEFNPIDGIVYVNNEGQEDVFGPYTQSGATLTLVQARVVSDVNPHYEALYYMVSIDLKQSSIDVIQVLFANTPARIVSIGIGTEFEFLTIRGTENFTPVRAGRKSRR